MIGKIVRVSSPEILLFFYPGFRLKAELDYSDRDRDIIYIGPMRRGIKEYLRNNTRSFISTVGIPDIDFSNREQLLKWLFFKKGKECPNSVIEQSVNYDEGYFLQCVKIFWMLGRWVGSKDSDISLYNLFSSTQESLRSSIDIYFKLLEELPAPVVESSFLTFLSRVKNVSEQSAKPGYMKLLKLCNSKFGSKIKPSVYRFAVRNKIRDELAFIDLLIDLR